LQNVVDQARLEATLNLTDDQSVKLALALKLNKLIQRLDLKQAEAAIITGMTQPKISQVSRYKLKNISLERIMQAIVSMNQQVDIVVQPAQGALLARIKFVL
jgi:predicted XRE-type DNA-binding protein